MSKWRQLWRQDARCRQNEIVTQLCSEFANCFCSDERGAAGCLFLPNPKDTVLWRRHDREHDVMYCY